jgi:hypothetical protein
LQAPLSDEVIDTTTGVLLFSAKRSSAELEVMSISLARAYLTQSEVSGITTRVESLPRDPLLE